MGDRAPHGGGAAAWMASARAAWPAAIDRVPDQRDPGADPDPAGLLSGAGDHRLSAGGGLGRPGVRRPLQPPGRDPEHPARRRHPQRQLGGDLAARQCLHRPLQGRHRGVAGLGAAGSRECRPVSVRDRLRHHPRRRVPLQSRPCNRIRHLVLRPHRRRLRHAAPPSLGPDHPQQRARRGGKRHGQIDRRRFRLLDRGRPGLGSSRRADLLRGAGPDRRTAGLDSGGDLAVCRQRAGLGHLHGGVGGAGRVWGTKKFFSGQSSRARPATSRACFCSRSPWRPVRMGAHRHLPRAGHPRCGL